MYCKKCGNKLLNTDKFCPSCGNEIELNNNKINPRKNIKEKIIVVSACLVFLLLSITIVLIITSPAALSDDEQYVVDSLPMYKIKFGKKIYDVYPVEVIKATANDMDFYIEIAYHGNGTFWSDTYVYTSIVSSVYEKYRKSIEEIALKYGLSLKYNFSTIEYSDGNHFNYCPICDWEFITIDARNKDETAISQFVNDIMSIDEIRNLYELSGDGTSTVIIDYSKIITGGEFTDYTRIFEYYKDMNNN